MSVRPASRFALLVLAVLLTGALVAPAVAAPPPEPVCAGCSDAFVQAASESHVDLTVTESVATVQVHENGSATWTVRHRVAGPDSGRVLENASLRERLAREASAGEYLGSVGRDDAVVYRYRLADFAEPGVGGILLSDFLRQDLRVANYDSLGADEVTIVAPAGMEVGRAPSESTVEADRFTLTSVDQELVTFVPAGDTLGVPKGWLGMADHLSPVVTTNVGILLVPALLAYTLVVGGVLLLLGRLLPPSAGTRGQRVAVGVLGGAACLAAALAVSVVAGVSLPEGAPPALIGAAVGLVLVATSIRGRTPASASGGATGYSPKPLVTVGVAAAVLTAVVVAAVLPGSRVLDGAAMTLSLTAPTFSLLPAGRGIVRGETLRAVGAVMVGFVVGAFASPALYHAPQGVVFPGFPAGFVAAGAVLVVGAPLLLAGWAVAGTRPNRGPSPP